MHLKRRNIGNGLLQVIDSKVYSHVILKRCLGTGSLETDLDKIIYAEVTVMVFLGYW